MSLGPIVVQKYGGSSVATAEKILAIAERVKTYLETHPHLVVAVSAMGKTTDQLVALAQAGVEESARPRLRPAAGVGRAGGGRDPGARAAGQRACRRSR